MTKKGTDRGQRNFRIVPSTERPSTGATRWWASTPNRPKIAEIAAASAAAPKNNYRNLSSQSLLGRLRDENAELRNTAVELALEIQQLRRACDD